jgi:hypothetical protein
MTLITSCKVNNSLKNSSLFDEFVYTNELNTTFFGSTSPLKAPNRLKFLKLA